MIMDLHPPVSLPGDMPIATALNVVPPHGVAAVTGIKTPLLEVVVLPVVYGRDLIRMKEMGLGELPVEAITYLNAPPPLLIQRLLMPDTPEAKAPTAQSRQTSRPLCDLFPRKFATALYELQSLFRRHHLKGWLIGGIARDLLRATDESELRVQDVDITVEGDAIEVARWIAEASSNFDLAETYPEFGTAKLTYKGWMALDFASTRRETYSHCGALPEVIERGVALPTDLIRRDFTMNTLALSVHQLGEVVDYTGGANDAQAGLIRVLHGASFFEDPSRILRAFKFATRFQCAIELNTQHLIQQFLHYADAAHYRAGGARIRTVLESWLSMDETEDKRRWVLYWLETGGWRLVMPTLDYCPQVLLVQGLQNLAHFWRHWLALEETIRYLSRDEDEDAEEGSNPWLWPLYLCLLLRGMCQPAALELAEHRLALSRSERDMVADFIKLDEKQPLNRLTTQSTPVELVETFEPHPLTSLLAEIALQPRAGELLKLLIYYQTQLAHIQTELKGDDLIALGVPATKGLGQLLRQLRRKRILGEITSRLEEIHFVQQHLKQP